MKIIHAKTTRNKRIRAIPVTGNFLIRGNDGAYRWSEPNERWRMFSPTGGTKCIITNLRRDDTEHSPDLWLYSNLTQKEVAKIVPDPNYIADLFADNRLHIDRTRKWYVRQFIESKERIGIKRFTGLPFGAFWDMWRKRMNANDIQIFGMNNQQMKIIYGKHTFNIFLRWQELQNDILNSTSQLNPGKNKQKHLRVSEKVMPWLYKNCEGDFIPFSDYDSIFENVQDEFSYIADVA